MQPVGRFVSLAVGHFSISHTYPLNNSIETVMLLTTRYHSPQSDQRRGHPARPASALTAVTALDSIFSMDPTGRAHGARDPFGLFPLGEDFAFGDECVTFP